MSGKSGSYTGPKEATKARNLELAASNGQRLDSLGRKRASPQQMEEEQTYTDPETGEVSLRWRMVPRDAIRCRAIIRSDSNPWKGNQCANACIHGGIVCRHHGGALPNVKKAAERRLMLASDPAAQKLVWMALYKKNIEDGDRIRALLAILDRAGIAGKTTIELEIKPWQKVLQNIYGQMTGGGEVIEGELVEGEDYELMDVEGAEDEA